MTPTAVRMVLVEGAGDGVTQDTSVCEVAAGGAAEQVAAAILGTRESLVDGAHRLSAVGVAWAEHADGARLRDVLRASDIDDVVMVSELHAASALAQAVGRRTGCERTALVFAEGRDVTVAVVRSVDGAVVGVRSRALPADDPDAAVAGLQDMVAACELSAEPPQAVFVMGAGDDWATLAARIGETTMLPVHAPEDADLALARGAALAAAAAPRFEAQTVVVPGPAEPSADTAVGVTRAAAAYVAPLGYSAVADEDAGPTQPDDVGPDHVAADDGPVRAADAAPEKPFLLVGSTLATIFVVGVLALVISLAVRISPVVEQRPESEPGIAPPGQAALQQDGESPTAVPATPVETIQAPVPVVQEAPRAAVLPPVAPGPAAAPVVPAAVPAPAPAPAAAPPVPAAVAPAPVPAAPAPVATVTVPAAPAPAVPPIVVAPVIPMLPPLWQPPIRVPAVPSPKAPATPNPATSVPATAAPSTAPPSTAPAPSTVAQTAVPAPSTVALPTAESPSPSNSGRGSGRGESGSGSRGSQSPLWPLWPPFGS